MVLAFLVFVNINVRIWMISMKYASYSNKMYHKIHEVELTKEEFEGELMGANWGNFDSKVVLSEIAASVVR